MKKSLLQKAPGLQMQACRGRRRRWRRRRREEEREEGGGWREEGEVGRREPLANITNLTSIL